MSLARVHTWIPGEILNASDLNAEFNSILTNALTLVSPVSGAFDFDGVTVTLDAAAATQVVSSAAVSWNFTSGAKTGTPGTGGSVERFAAQTFTDSATAGSGTATAAVFYSIAAPTLAATNASVVTTDAATWYIAGPPTAGTNETITNGWALWVDAGAVRFDGALQIAGALSGVATLGLSGAQSGGTTHSLAGPITLTTAASKIIPGATSLSLRNNADSADNILITDAGAVTVRSSLTIGGESIPQNSQSAAYTTVAADANKHILHPTADNNARTFTIAANASVAYAVGTVITFCNQINTVTIAINSDTLTLAGAGTTGSRTLAASGIATALKVSSTGWTISGVGLT